MRGHDAGPAIRDRILLMLRTLLSLLLCVLTSYAQTKKIIVKGADPATLKEYQSVSPKARVIGVTAETVMQEIGDADAFIGTITPAEVRAGKKLKWVQVMSAGVGGTCFFPAATICATATSS